MVFTLASSIFTLIINQWNLLKLALLILNIISRTKAVKMLLCVSNQDASSHKLLSFRADFLLTPAVATSTEA